MKLAMNGAFTIGTCDGANVEIRETVGAENLFLFGMTVEDVQWRLAQGYRPYDRYESDQELRAAIDAVTSAAFSNGDRDLFKPIVDNLLGSDPYMLLADYRSYVEGQEEVGRVWRDAERWTRWSILNVARMGRFSSDRSVRAYCRGIWHVGPVPVPDWLADAQIGGPRRDRVVDRAEGVGDHRGVAGERRDHVVGTDAQAALHEPPRSGRCPRRIAICDIAIGDLTL